MKTKVLPTDHSEALPSALKILRAGGLVAFPTDTVYGLGALAFDNTAIESIYNAKDRPVEKAIPILIGDLSDLDKVADDIPNMALRFAATFAQSSPRFVLPIFWLRVFPAPKQRLRPSTCTPKGYNVNR